MKKANEVQLRGNNPQEDRLMTTDQNSSKEKPDLEGISFWRDYYDFFTDEQPQTDEGDSISAQWGELDLYWRHVGPHPFKIGDRIILFNDEATPDLPSSVSAVTAIEVVDIGPAEIREQDGDLSHFIAYRRLKGFKPVPLSLDPILELRPRGILSSIADLQNRKKLSSEEWDQIVKSFNLRQEQAETEKQPKRKSC
jgi:hypothetical protein